MLKEVLRRIKEPQGLDLAAISSLLQDMRDHAEEMHRVEFEQQLEVVPWLCSLLDTVIPPSLVPDSAEHAARGRALEVIARIPNNEHLRAHVPQLLRTATAAAAQDSEENALLALKFMFQQHKFHRSSAELKATLEEQAALTLAFAMSVLDSMHEAVTGLVNEGLDSAAFTSAAYEGSQDFALGTGITAPVAAGLAALAAGTIGRRGGSGSGAGEAAGAAAPSPTLAVARGTSLCPSRLSFRVACEMHLLVVLLLQSHSALLHEYLPRLCEAMAGFVRIFPVPDALSLGSGHLPSTACALATTPCAHPTAASVALSPGALAALGAVEEEQALRSSSSSSSGTPGAPTLRALRHLELLAAQAKGLTSLQYFQRLAAALADGQAQAAKVSQVLLADAVFRMLASLPMELGALRKEVLTALRFYVSNDATAFARDAMALLDERVLLGSSSSGAGAVLWANESLRQTANFALAEVIHAVRDKLTLEQQALVVDTSTRAILDPTLPCAVATIFLQLLTKFTQAGVHDAGASASPTARTQRRCILNMMLSTVVSKLGALRTYIPTVLAAEKRESIDVARERVLAAAQTQRISAAAELVADWQLHGSGSSGASLGAAAALLEGLQRGSVSPWVADDYSDWIGSTHVIDTSRDVKTLVRLLLILSKSIIEKLLNMHRDDTELAQRFSAMGQAGAVDTLPATPGSEGPGLPSVEACEGGGVNGLGPASHGTYLSEQELSNLSLYMRWGCECLDIYLLTTPLSTQELTEAIESYCGVLTALERDRNHLRDLLTATLPFIMERILTYPSLRHLVQHLFNVAGTTKVLVEAMLSAITRHIHLLNAGDDDDLAEWRWEGPEPPTGAEARPAAPLHALPPPGRALGSQSLYGSTTVANERTRRGIGLCRLQSSQPQGWRFNEDGEFDAVLGVGAGAGADAGAEGGQRPGTLTQSSWSSRGA